MITRSGVKASVMASPRIFRAFPLLFCILIFFGDQLWAHNRGIVLVIPTYKELSSGNLARLLYPLRRLRRPGGEPWQVHALFVVNNSAEEAEPTSPYFKTYLENQASLDFLKDEAKKQKDPSNSEFQIRVLDHSTSGAGAPSRTLFPTIATRRIGLVRHVGVMDALKNIVPQGERNEWLIAMTDADSMLDENWLLAIDAAFKNPEVRAGLTFLDWFLPPGSELRTMQTSVNARIQYHSHQVSIGINFGSALPWGGGPRVVARASVFEEFGGFPKSSYAEDWRFIDWLRGQGIRTVSIPDAKSFVSDRARAESYDSAVRLEHLNAGFLNGAHFSASEEVPRFRDDLLKDWQFNTRRRLLASPELAYFGAIIREYKRMRHFLGNRRRPPQAETLDRFFDTILSQFLTVPEINNFNGMLREALDQQQINSRQAFEELHALFQEMRLSSAVNESENTHGQEIDPDTFQRVWLTARANSQNVGGPTEVGRWMNLILNLPTEEFEAFLARLPRNEAEAEDYVTKTFSDDFNPISPRRFTLIYLTVLSRALFLSHNSPGTWPGLQTMVHVLRGEISPPKLSFCEANLGASLPWRSHL